MMKLLFTFVVNNFAFCLACLPYPTLECINPSQSLHESFPHHHNEGSLRFLNLLNVIEIQHICNDLCFVHQHHGLLAPAIAMEADDVLLRADFVREVAALLQEVQIEQSEAEDAQGLDPESVASRLKQQEKQQAIRQVEALLDLAMNLNL